MSANPSSLVLRLWMVREFSDSRHNVLPSPQGIRPHHVPYSKFASASFFFNVSFSAFKASFSRRSSSIILLKLPIAP